MILILIVALLAGVGLAAGEFLFILLTCGPYWIRPLDLFPSAAIYAAAALPGVAALYLLLLLPPLRRRIQTPMRRFAVLLAAGWVVGSGLLVKLVDRDLDHGQVHWLLLVVMVVLGIAVGVAARLALRGRRRIHMRGLALTLGVVLITLVIWLGVDMRAATVVRARALDFRGNVPHVCLVVLDTTRGDHLSCYGYDRATTPNIDRIAAEGLLFRNTLSAANWTPPGHIAIFTGTYPSQHANDGKPYMPDVLVSMAEILREEGFYNIGLFNNHLAGTMTNITQGFDFDAGVYRDAWVGPAWQRLRERLGDRDAGARPTFRAARRTLEWFDRRGGHLFLYLNLIEPHAGYDIHEPYFTRFMNGVRPQSIPNLRDLRRFCRNIRTIKCEPGFFADYTEESFAYLRAAYDSEIAYTDAQVALLADPLRRRGILDRTALVITSDHGEFLGERDTRGHPALMLNPVLRIPLILRYPPRVDPGVDEAVASNVDVLPTLFGLMGYESLVPAAVQGVDLLAGGVRPDRMLLSERIEPGQGSRSLLAWPLKLVVSRDSSLVAKCGCDTMLFNLSVDPDETRNLADARPQPAAHLADSLAAWVGQIALPLQADTRGAEKEELREKLRALGYIN